MDTPEEVSTTSCDIFFGEMMPAKWRVVLRAVVLALKEARGTRVMRTQGDEEQNSSVYRWILSIDSVPIYC